MNEARPQPALSPEEQERIAAVDRHVVDGAVPALVDMLADPSWTVRRAVVRGLAALGDLAVQPLYLLLVSGRDDETRNAAVVDALAASKAGLDGLIIGATSDPNPAVVVDAAQILGRRRTSAAVPALTLLLNHRDDNAAVAAVEALGRIGGRAAVESLITLVGSGNFFRTFPAIDVLGRSGDPRAVAPLAAQLGQPTFAPEAARALGRTGELGAVAPLAALLARAGEANSRIAALALTELFDRYHERFGVTAPVEDALRRAVDPAHAARRLTQSLSSSDATEKSAIARVLGILRDESAVAPLLALLDAPGPVAQAASGALQRLVGSDEEALIRDLEQGDSMRRRLLLPLMRRSSSANAVLRCLGDEDPLVRVAACDALARMGSPLAARPLFDLVADDNARVAQAAIAAIQSLGSPETEALALAAARSTDAAMRRAGLRILSYFGYASALPLFAAAIAGDDVRARDVAVQGLPFLDDRGAIEELLSATHAADERLRATAMRALGQCRGTDPRVTSALLRGVGDGDAWVRYYACQSLGRLGVEAASGAIAARVSDEAGQVRVAAIEALSHVHGEAAFTALCDAAGASDADLRRAALVGLGLSRRGDACPLLERACSDGDAATRLVAVSAIAAFDTPATLAVLTRAAADADESVRTVAVGFLAARTDGAATEALISLLPRATNRDRIVAALAISGEARIAGLTAALAEADDELAPSLVSALVRMRRPEANLALVQAFGRASPRARKAVASGLAAIATPEALATLQRAAAHDADQEVRRISALLLAQ